MPGKLFAALAGGALILGESCLAGNTAGLEQEVGRVTFYNYDEREKASNVPEMKLPTATVYRMSALAVGKISGVVPVTGEYVNKNLGPDCRFTLEMKFPFKADTIVDLGDVLVEPGNPDTNGRYDATVKLSSNYSLFNPRVTLNDADQKYDSKGFNLCSKNSEDYANFYMELWKVGQAASASAADCLVAPEGNSIRATELRKVYDKGLEEDIRTLMPNVDELVWDRTNTASTASERPYKAKLEQTIREAQESNDHFRIDAKPVEECRFESLTIDSAVKTDQRT